MIGVLLTPLDTQLSTYLGYASRDQRKMRIVVRCRWITASGKHCETRADSKVLCCISDMQMTLLRVGEVEAHDHMKLIDENTINR
ncbi:hypothetical protein AAC387_Pa03g0844 [Persea americana]